MFRLSDLEAYLDEALAPDEMARIEKAARDDTALVRHLASVQARRSAGVHSLGEIWRAHRLSCPTRAQLGSFLLGALPEELARYIAFHVEVGGCRWCQANVADLQRQQGQPDPAAQARRRKYFQSSAGFLKKGEGGRGKGEGS
jgi:hypothetical protein